MYTVAGQRYRMFHHQGNGINPKKEKERKLEIQIPSCIALFVNLPVNVTYSTFNCQDNTSNSLPTQEKT